MLVPALSLPGLFHPDSGSFQVEKFDSFGGVFSVLSPQKPQRSTATAAHMSLQTRSNENNNLEAMHVLYGACLWFVFNGVGVGGVV